MGKPRRHPQHMVVLLGERGTHPAPEGRRTAPDVDRDVVHGAGHDPDELPLRLLNLVVQPAQDIPRRAAVIVLYELHIESGGSEFTLLPGLEEKATRVAKHLRPD